MRMPEQYLVRSVMLLRLHGIGLVRTEICNKVMTFKKLHILFSFM